MMKNISLMLNALYLHFILLIKYHFFISTLLVLQIFLIKSDITEVSEQPKCQLSALNDMAICDQRHAKGSKQTIILAGDDDAPPIGAD